MTLDFNYKQFGITPEELEALQGRKEIALVKTFSVREIIAMEYAVLISRVPLLFPSDLVDKLKANFNEREIVIFGQHCCTGQLLGSSASSSGCPTDRIFRPLRD